MLITPLQKLLQDEVISLSVIRAETGKSRTTIWRWLSGKSCPERADAEKLIELYRDHGLDFNGCYEKSVEATEK